jgi:hypothetical protein
MQKKDAKKAAKVQGGFTQQSAEDAALRHSDRAAWTWSLLVRRDFFRPSITPS